MSYVSQQVDTRIHFSFVIEIVISKIKRQSQMTLPFNHSHISYFHFDPIA